MFNEYPHITQPASNVPVIEEPDILVAVFHCYTLNHTLWKVNIWMV